MKLCDCCGQQKDTRRVRITIEGEHGMIADLCDSCRRPLHKVMAGVAETRRPRVSVASLPVATVDDIAKLRRRGGRARKQAAVSPPEPR